MFALTPPRSCPASLPAQQGAGTIEFAIVALPILFLGLGGIELAHWFYTRQAISLALLDAGRAAITDHNRSASIIRVFEHALRPIYAAPTKAATTQRIHSALATRKQRMGTAPWQIEVLSPSIQAYTDFSDANVRVDGAAGHPVINNHYLAEQDADYRQQGWIDGRGPVSGQTVFEANTAVLRLSWLHESRLPLMAPLLRALGNPKGSYRQRALAQGYLPMTRQITLLMQSHPVFWSNDPSEKVIYRPQGSPLDETCSGWLCNSGRHAVSTPDGLPAPDGTSLPTYPMDPSTPPGYDDAGGGFGAGTIPGERSQSYPDLTVDPGDPMCGVTLCCV